MDLKLSKNCHCCSYSYHLRRIKKNFFSTFKHQVRMDPFTNRSRGFGYVTFSDKSFVDVAVAQRDNHYIDGKWVDVKACIPMHKDHKIARANNFAQNKQMNMMGKTGGGLIFWC